MTLIFGHSKTLLERAALRQNLDWRLGIISLSTHSLKNSLFVTLGIALSHKNCIQFVALFRKDIFVRLFSYFCLTQENYLCGTDSKAAARPRLGLKPKPVSLQPLNLIFTPITFQAGFLITLVSPEIGLALSKK